MEITLALIFGFMIFMIILNKGHLYFFSITSLLIVAVISFGVGYGIAAFVISVLGPLLKGVLVVAAVLVGISMLSGVLKKDG